MRVQARLQSEMKRKTRAVTESLPSWLTGFTQPLRGCTLTCMAGLLACLWLGSNQGVMHGDEVDTNSAPASTNETSSQEILRAYLQLQEQLHLTQLAVEQNRHEAREVAVQSSETLAGRLHAIEIALEAQRTRELEAMQSSNREILLVAGTFAAVGFLAMLLMAFFQWRTVTRLADISAALPGTFALATPQNRPALGPGDSHAVAIGPAEQSSMRLLGAVEQLEKRVYELEHTTRTPLNETSSLSNGGKPPSVVVHEPGGSHLEVPREHAPIANRSALEHDRVTLLLGKGQSMLNLDDAHAAVACFEEALAIDPNNAEAWVRKGTALEQLQQLEQAIQCYDRALAADNSMTIAYLHKGGLFNRMERFSEALECYEKALRTQEKRHVAG